MRLVVGLLALAGAVNLALADDPPASPAAPAAAAQSADAAAKAAADKAAADKAAADKDIEHFTQQGFKPEMRGGHELYCRKETVIGSRLASQKTCGTIAELKQLETQTRQSLEQAQQRQSAGPSSGK